MKLACVGNALYDIVAFVEPDFASRLGYHVGSTVHAQKADIDAILPFIRSAARGAGGGATNTARVFASLGHAAGFAGMIGTDTFGKEFYQDLESSSVELYMQYSDAPTGVFCALIAPGGARTIIVAPSKAPCLVADDIPDGFFSSKATLYIDGFLAAHPETVLALVHRAQSHDMKIALDIASFRTVVKNRDLFLKLIRESCSWTFMNEDEFIALSESGVDDALQSFSADAPGIVVVKRAEIGAVCVSDGFVLESAVRPIHATDTTGAGDAFAAGFLSAALSGAPLARCLRLGNRVAEHTIQIPGLSLDAARLQQAASTVL